MARKHQLYSERESLAPYLGAEEKAINGTTEVVFTIKPRAVIIAVAWSHANDLLVKFVGDTAFTTLSSATIIALGTGFYPLAIQSFKSSGTGETGFVLVGLE